jgi:hypothetical protein
MRSRSWLRRVIVGVLVSLILTTVWLVGQRAWRRSEGNRELEAVVAAADATDPGWRWEPLNAARKRPPADQNAATLMPRIKALSAKDWGKWAIQHPDHVPDIASNVLHPAGVLTAVRQDLAASSEAVKLARTLKSLLHGHREITLAENPIGTMIEDTTSTRHVADLLRWDVVVALEDGKHAVAAEDLLAALNVSRSIGDEPFLISQLLRIATRAVALRSVERALAQCARPKDLDALNLPELQAALTRDADEPLLLFGLRGERAVLDILFQKMDDGSLDLEEATIGRQPRGSAPFEFGKWLYRGRIPADRAFAMQWMTAAIEAARGPVHEQPPVIGALPIPPDDRQHILSRMLLPAIDRVAVAFWRSVAEGRCAIVGIACERFRLKHGRWPDTLAQLCPEFLPAVPLDPADGQPLRYAKQPDGVVVSSAIGPVPPNPAFPQARATPRPGLPEGVEVGFRLWNPEARRQPPPPEPLVPPEQEQP